MALVAVIVIIIIIIIIVVVKRHKCMLTIMYTVSKLVFAANKDDDDLLQLRVSSCEHYQ